MMVDKLNPDTIINNILSSILIPKGYAVEISQVGKYTFKIRYRVKRKKREGD